MPFILAVLLLVLLPPHEAAGQSVSVLWAEPEARMAEALRLRETHAYAAAARLLARHVVHHPDDLQARRLLAQTLYWAGEVEAARTRYEQLLAREPEDRPLRLEYGRMLTELNDAPGARRVLAPLRGGERFTAAEAEALLGQLAYWEGKLTRAASHFQTALRLHPEQPLARALLEEIRLASAPSFYLRSGYQQDNQPVERLHLETGVAWFVTPQQTVALRARPQRVGVAGGVEGIGAIEGALQSYWPALRLQSQVAGGVLRRSFTEERDWTGQITLGLRLPAHLELRGAAERAPYTATEASLAVPVMVESLRGTLVVRRPEGWLGEASYQSRRYPDANVVSVLYAWLLAPVVRGEAVDVLAGYAASYQDAAESRFSAAPPRAAGRAPARNDLSGIYTPYHTPEREQTHSFAAAVSIRPAPALTLDANGSYGLFATEAAPYFRRLEAGAPGQGALQRDFYQRRFHPFTLRCALNARVSPALDLRLEAETMRTAYWSAGQVEVGMVYRHLGRGRVEGASGPGTRSPVRP